MPLAQDFRQTVIEELQDPKYRRAYFCEMINALLRGDLDTAKPALRILIKATNVKVNMSDAKTICTEQDLAEAIAEADRLWDSPQDTPEADRLNALMTSIDVYESKFPPNAETIAAMEAGERGEVTCFDSIEALMADLKADD
jgi:hypothetical protein